MPEAPFPGQPQPGPEALPDALPQTRRVYIRQNDLDDFSYTRGFPKCTHVRVYGETLISVGHSDTCRKRIMDKLSETLAGRACISAAADRADRDVGEAICHQDPDEQRRRGVAASSQGGVA